MSAFVIVSQRINFSSAVCNGETSKLLAKTKNMQATDVKQLTAFKLEEARGTKRPLKILLARARGWLCLTWWEMMVPVPYRPARRGRRIDWYRKGVCRIDPQILYLPLSPITFTCWNECFSFSDCCCRDERLAMQQLNLRIAGSFNFKIFACTLWMSLLWENFRTWKLLLSLVTVLPKNLLDAHKHTSVKFHHTACSQAKSSRLIQFWTEPFQWASELRQFTLPLEARHSCVGGFDWWICTMPTCAHCGAHVPFSSMVKCECQAVSTKCRPYSLLWCITMFRVCGRGRKKHGFRPPPHARFCGGDKKGAFFGHFFRIIWRYFQNFRALR